MLVVDDHAMLAQALALVLEQEGMEVLVATDLTDDGIEATAAEFGPDVVLLDLYLAPHRTSLPVIAPLTASGSRVLVLTASDDAAELAACLRAGAAAVLPKADALGESLEAVRLALAGETVRAQESAALRAAGRSAVAGQAALNEPFERLTARECDILAAVLDGKRANEIAAELAISLSTVRSHLEAIRTKLGVRSQLEAVALARQAGWPKAP